VTSPTPGAHPTGVGSVDSSAGDTAAPGVRSSGSGDATDAAVRVLPRLLLLTDRRQARRPLPDVVAAAIDGGARAVVLREKDLGYADRRALAARLAALLAPVGGTLLLALPTPPATPTGRQTDDPGRTQSGAGDRHEVHSEWGAHGVHLPAGAPVPTPRPRLVGRSCHNATELAAAEADGVDYVTLSPIFPTPSKPGYGPPLGLAGLERLTARTRLPVYALGGVTVREAAACLAAGVAGVAVMGEVMRSTDPAATVAALVKEVA